MRIVVNFFRTSVPPSIASSSHCVQSTPRSSEPCVTLAEYSRTSPLTNNSSRHRTRASHRTSHQANQSTQNASHLHPKTRHHKASHPDSIDSSHHPNHFHFLADSHLQSPLTSFLFVSGIPCSSGLDRHTRSILVPLLFIPLPLRVPLYPLLLPLPLPLYIPLPPLCPFPFHCHFFPFSAAMSMSA